MLREVILCIELFEFVLENRNRQFDVVRGLEEAALVSIPLLRENNQTLLQVPVQTLKVLDKLY